MIIGKVIGNVWATRKQEELNGFCFLIIEPHKFQQTDNQSPFVAVDTVGAGIDEVVLVVSGNSARVVTENSCAPIDSAVVAIIDKISMGKYN